MKYLLLAILLLSAVYCEAQKKDTNRYFEAAYFGQDSSGHIKYGTYFFAMKNGIFPTIEETRTLIIADYKLEFSPIDDKMAIWLTEFKNKKEFDKWNH